MSKDIGIPLALLAGGLATRLRPLTETVPKVLLDVGGKPFLEILLRRLREQGISDVVLCAGFLGNLIEERFGNGHAYGVNLTYSFDGAALLGTGGAIRNALPLLGQSFFVMYGDSYLNIDLRDVAETFTASGKPGLMTVFRNENHWDTSNVVFSDGHIIAYDKKLRGPEMLHIDYGLSMFHNSVFSSLPMGIPVDLAEVMKNLVSAGSLTGYEAKERFYEIGSHEGLAELNDLLRKGDKKQPDD